MDGHSTIPCASGTSAPGAVIEGITSAAGGKKSIQMHVVCFGLWDEERGKPREDAPRTHIEAAMARRKDEFALSHLAWTAAGYTIKFRRASSIS